MNTNSTQLKPVLLISASDSSAAAGMQMDLRVLNNLGTPARCAFTAVTVQGDSGAKSINPVEPKIILDSISTALDDPPGVGAVKIGLIGDSGTAEILEEPLSTLKAQGIPIVADPVMKSTPGFTLSAEGTAAAYIEKIIPNTTLLTPNHEELETLNSLAGGPKGDLAAMAGQLMASGADRILVTGGDAEGDQCLDILFGPGGGSFGFGHPRIGSTAPRGTGCALSAAIAAHLARGIDINEAVGWSIDYITGLIEKAVMVGNQLLLLTGVEP